MGRLRSPAMVRRETLVLAASTQRVVEGDYHGRPSIKRGISWLGQPCIRLVRGSEPGTTRGAVEATQQPNKQRSVP